MSIDLFANRQDWSQGACANATETIDGELAVRSNFTNLNIQCFLEGIDDFLSAFDEAGSTHADGDGIFALWNHGKEGIKADNTINLGQGNIHIVSNELLNFLGQVTEKALCFVKHGN